MGEELPYRDNDIKLDLLLIALLHYEMLGPQENQLSEEWEWNGHSLDDKEGSGEC